MSADLVVVIVSWFFAGALLSFIGWCFWFVNRSEPIRGVGGRRPSPRGKLRNRREDPTQPRPGPRLVEPRDWDDFWAAPTPSTPTRHPRSLR